MLTSQQVCLFFFQVRNEFYKDTQGAMLVYDVGNRDSFDALDSWLEEIKRDIGNPADVDKIVFSVCANKVNHYHDGDMPLSSGNLTQFQPKETLNLLLAVPDKKEWPT